jgi:hypothetical protein
MNHGSAFDLVCSCRAKFLSQGALKIHQNACKKNKERLSRVLQKLQGASVSRKRKVSSESISTTGNDAAAVDIGGNPVEDVNNFLLHVLPDL